MRKAQYKVGDLVKTVTGSAIVAKGRIKSIVAGGTNLGFSWEDDTPHYEIKDIKTNFTIFVDEESLEYVRS